MKTAENIDLTIPRRRYIYDDINLTNCSECGSPLIDQNCTILLQVKSETDEAEFITNLTGSHFCDHCPVVVFDSDKIKQAAILGIRGSENLRHFIKGIIDLDSIPENKRHLEMGTDENPIPLVRFLPDLNKHPKIAQKKPQRNDPCPCGSSKKYKNCCSE